MGVSAPLLVICVRLLAAIATTGAHSGEAVRHCDFVQVVGLAPQGQRIFYRLLGGDWPPLFPYHRQLVGVEPPEFLPTLPEHVTMLQNWLLVPDS